MFTKKLGGSVVAMTALFAFGSVYANDPGEPCHGVAEAIKGATPSLVCVAFGGTFEAMTGDGPIWQFGKTKRDTGLENDGISYESGCEVHSSLAAQLYVAHDPNSPPTNKGSKNGFREAKGAANSLFDGKFEDALMHLDNFITAIDADPTTDALEQGSAKLSSDPNAEKNAKQWRDYALAWRQQVAYPGGCMPAPTL